MKAITFLEVVQKCYNVFSSSPQRWEILKKKISGSLHSLSNTSGQIDAVKPFVNDLPELQNTLEVSEVLSAINERHVVFQAKNSTIDVEVINLESLIADLQLIRNNWKTILREYKIVASGLKNTSSKLQVSWKRKRVKVFSKNNEEEFITTDEETDFKIETFFVIIRVDSVITDFCNFAS